MVDELKDYTFPQEEPAVDNTATPESTADNLPTVEKQTSDKDQNLRYLREKADAAERRAQELERMIQMNMNQQQHTKIQVEEDDELDISDDTYVEGKQLKKYIKELKKDLKNTKKQFEETSYKNVVANAEMRLKSQFTDFDNVVTKDNLNKLANMKPSLYRSIMSNQDIYDQGYSAYDIIKSSGIMDDTYASQDKKMEDNRSKPRSAGSVSPQDAEVPTLSRVGDYDRRILTPERKEQLRRQVEEAKRYR